MEETSDHIIPMYERKYGSDKKEIDDFFHVIQTYCNEILEEKKEMSVCYFSDKTHKLYFPYYDISIFWSDTTYDGCFVIFNEKTHAYIIPSSREFDILNLIDFVFNFDDFF
jgi:hypothetical protein